MTLQIVPVTLAQANEFIVQHHRHHGKVLGCRFCLGVAQDGQLVGVAIAGRPVARMLDDGTTLEVNRSCTDGTRNANSMLYGACARAAKAVGYKRLITYTLPDEGGSSLRAAGFECKGKAGGGSWSCPSRPRIDQAPLDPKWRWERLLT
jgi:hypothetical protein